MNINAMNAIITCYSHQHPLTKQKLLCFYPFRSGKTDVGHFLEIPIKIGPAAFLDPFKIGPAAFLKSL